MGEKDKYRDYSLCAWCWSKKEKEEFAPFCSNQCELEALRDEEHRVEALLDEYAAEAEAQKAADAEQEYLEDKYGRDYDGF